MKRKRHLMLSALLCLVSQPLFSDEIKTTAQDQRALSLTIYNGGRALVKDQRQVNLEKPASRLAFMDVAEKIMPQTVAFKGLDVLEQNYDYDLLSTQSLIEKNIGNSVRIARRSSETGETLEWTEGKILSTNGGIVLQMKDGSLESINTLSHYQMVFDAVPDNLRTSPTLSLLLRKPAQGRQDLHMTYLTAGLSWQSDYVLQLDASETRAALTGWITLNNQSGIGYHDAQLQLLAGDVNMQPDQQPRRMMEVMALSARADSGVQEQALHGYHLYTVPHKTTIKNRQSKQIKLLDAGDIPVHKSLRDRAYLDAQAIDPQKSKPDQFLKFNNSKPSLGLPIPRGTLRVYANDAEGREQFIGEDGIDHTAVNDELEIRLGKSFDITVQRNTTQFLQLSKKQQQVTRQIKINNGSDKSQVLRLSEIMPSRQWSIRGASHAHSQEVPTVADFDVTLPAQKETILTYDVLLTYP